MRGFLITLVLIPICQLLPAQNLEPVMVFPDTLRADIDTLYLDSPRFNDPIKHPIDSSNLLNMGTHGYKGVFMTIWTDMDTLVVPHVNFPYGQELHIPIASSRDTVMAVLRFQANTSDFSDEYASENKGQTIVSIPKTFELANIILYLTELSKQTGNHPQTIYTKELESHFGKFRNHPLITTLNRLGEKSLWDTYYGFRENSITFVFENDFLEYKAPHKHVYWDNTGMLGGQFRNLLYLVQDFSNKSDFQTFFNKHTDFYNDLIARQRELLPLGKMWTWLEDEFPNRMNAYKVFFSPLIGGSHSTQRYQKGFFADPDYEECVMFINSPADLDNTEYSEKLKEGLMSGIVFTEIDHNYVNPASDLHKADIKKLIRDKDRWATIAAQANYPSESAIFNEYMTHALFCVYVSESYEPEKGDQIIQMRIALMKRRGYPLFEKFNDKLLELAKDCDLTFFEMYDEIISEMEDLNK